MIQPVSTLSLKIDSPKTIESNGTSIPIVLTIAGSDSGGGAGIQADIKTISATGSYACSVITALTAQNTLGVDGVMVVEPNFIGTQLDSVFSDLTVQVVKIGMLADIPTIRSVVQSLAKYKPKLVVLDPVMVATSGDTLLAPDAVDYLISELIPLADVITPNLYEALVLLNRSTDFLPKNVSDFEQLAKDLTVLGCCNVLLKGGHFKESIDANGINQSMDLLCSGERLTSYSAARVDTKNTHGTGCSLSSALASYLAQGEDLLNAVQLAKKYISKAIQTSNLLNVGNGSGPVNHFYSLHSMVSNDTDSTKKGGR